METLDGIWIIPSLKIHKIFTYANGESSLLSTFVPYIFIFGEQPVKDNHFILGLKLTQNKESLDCAEITLFISLYEDDLPPKGIHGSEKLEDFTPGNLRQVKWQYAGGIKTADDKIEWKDLELNNDSTNNFISSGKISFQFFEDLLTPIDIFSDIEGIKRENLSKKNNDDYFIWIRCTLSDDDYYPIPPRVSDIIPNTVSAELGSSLTDEYLVNTSSILVNNSERASNGLPHQIFEIKDKQHLPILRLEGIYRNKKCYGVYVDNKRWEGVDDFDNSNENDNHYVIDKINGVIKFGDGKNGSIPGSGSEVKINYVYGQVNNFNIPLNSEFEYVQRNNLNHDTKRSGNNYYLEARNRFSSSYGGVNFETLKDAMVRLRKEMKEPFKIVSSDDCEKIVKSTPGLRISQVKAIPSPEDNVLDVIVAPFTLKNNSFNYTPDQENRFLDTIKNHLDKHRLITTKINVYGPSYVNLTIRCLVVLAFNIAEKNGKDKIRDELLQYFRIHPSKTSPGWNFGQNVYKSDIYTKLNSLPEIDCIRDIQIEAEGALGSFNYKENDVIIAPRYLIMLKDVFISTINEML